MRSLNGTQAESHRSAQSESQSLAEANPLAEALVSIVREALRDTALLQRLAQQTSALTPNFHIDEHFWVLLEISASVKVFGSLAGCTSARIP